MPYLLAGILEDPLAGVGQVEGARRGLMEAGDDLHGLEAGLPHGPDGRAGLDDSQASDALAELVMVRLLKLVLDDDRLTIRVLGDDVPAGVASGPFALRA